MVVSFHCQFLDRLEKVVGNLDLLNLSGLDLLAPQGKTHKFFLGFFGFLHILVIG